MREAVENWMMHSMQGRLKVQQQLTDRMRGCGPCVYLCCLRSSPCLALLRLSRLVVSCQVLCPLLDEVQHDLQRALRSPAPGAHVGDRSNSDWPGTK